MSEVSCPSCGAKIKTGILGSNSLLTEEENELISLINDSDKKVYCQKCGIGIYSESLTKFTQIIKEAKASTHLEISSIPITTIHSPLHWDYEVVGFVTSKANLGTGVFAELSTTISDLAGIESGLYNDKLSEGESRCMKQLRNQAFSMGANAIAGVQITYSEIGTIKGLVLVCMVGTAVKVKNAEVLGEKAAGLSQAIFAKTEKLAKLKGRVPKIYKDLVAEVN